MLIEIESVLRPWLPWSGMDCIRDIRRSSVPLLRRSFQLLRTSQLLPTHREREDVCPAFAFSDPLQ
jgi:hypothetical protein